MKTKNSKSGFTLIELLVVISIISLLASVILSNVNSARGKAQLAAGQQFDANILHGIGDQLIGEWKFDEGSGTAVDTSSFGNNGTPFSATWSATGGYNGKGAYQFAYGSSYINLSNPKNLYLGAGDFTISAWINYNLTTPVDSTIFFEGVPSYGTGQIIALSVGNDHLQLSFYGPYVAGDITLPHNKWTHVAVSYRSSTRETSVYVNGALDKTGVMSSGIDTNTFNKNTIACAQIGKRYCFASYMDFVGFIDSVRLYTTRLTAMDIQNIYALEKPNHPDTVALK